MRKETSTTYKDAHEHWDVPVIKKLMRRGKMQECDGGVIPC